jgi:tRNA modification GTPase
MDTIFALATAPGKAGVAVVRVSGPEADTACARLAGTLPEPRYASLRILRDDDGRRLDQALVLRFSGDHSFTGEPVVEFQVHGSPAVVRGVLNALSQIPSLRHAEAGEFTRRALMNARLDLPQVEALGDLIEAETEAQHRLAMDGFTGGLTALADTWRDKLIEAVGLLEATIDFADEEVPVDVSADVCAALAAVEDGIATQLSGLNAAERVREGFEVAIVGPPNAGKSTLLNHLAGRDAAITSEHAGTTRDIIEVRMDIGGLAVTLLDTAGLRESDDPVERIGVDRARNRAERADLRVHLVPEGSVPVMPPDHLDLVKWAKADDSKDGAGVSGLTGAGVPVLLREIRDRLADRVVGAGLATRERHAVALRDAGTHLSLAQSILDSGPQSYDLASEEIRIAIRRLEALVGRVGVEDVLGHIFARFCVGK